MAMTEEERNLASNGAPQSKAKSTRKPRTASTTEDQSNALVTRIKGAHLANQNELTMQAVELADTVSDQVIEQVAPLIGLNIVEKLPSAIAKGGSLTTAFLRSTVTTGMQIENVFETEAELDDPLYKALMLTGA